MRVPIRIIFFALTLLVPLFTAAQDRPVVLKASVVLDGKGGTLRNTIVVVEGAKIVRIGGVAPAGAVIYDLTGLTVTPGWIDAHSHIYNHFYNNRHVSRDAPGREPPVHAALAVAGNALLTLMAGFTTIQSPGAPQDQDVRDAIAEGILPGARILTSLQPINGDSGPPEKIRELVRERKRQGADFIKIFASKSSREGASQWMSDTQIQAACAEAKSQGLRVLVHAHGVSEIKASVLAGCTAIEHGTSATDEVFELMAQRGTYYDPQVGLVLQNYLENKEKYVGTGNFTDASFADMGKGIPVAIEHFKNALIHHGLKIIYGTDANAGAHGRNYEEFIVRVRDGGQDPMAALISATSLTAASLGLADRIGVIVTGMEADIVGFDGNLLQDATAARRAVFVMKGGKVLENLPRGSKTPDARK